MVLPVCVCVGVGVCLRKTMGFLFLITLIQEATCCFFKRRLSCNWLSIVTDRCMISVSSLSVLSLDIKLSDLLTRQTCTTEKTLCLSGNIWNKFLILPVERKTRQYNMQINNSPGFSWRKLMILKIHNQASS